MKLSNSILTELEQSSLLYISLLGVRTLIEREFALKDMLLASQDSAITELRRRLNNPETNTVSYPYGYLSLSELTSVKDHTPNKNVKRHGWRMGTMDATHATSKKGYIFPILVQISLHYLDNDPIRTLRMAEALIILGQIGPLAFSLNVGEGIELEVMVEIPESAPIPIGEAESEHAPDAQEIEIPLVIKTYAGFFRDVSAVNSNKPIISFDLKSNYFAQGEE
jgi:hypothetical protein